MSSEANLFHIDSFSTEVFKGNPAAVYFLDEAKTDEWMQSLANELGLSETAFVKEKKGFYDLRWFTPTVEVDLCGHATLATAHALWESGRSNAQELEFHTKSGVLKAKRNRKKIVLDFPSSSPQERLSRKNDLEEALGAKAQFVGEVLEWYLAELESEKELRSLSPNFEQMRKKDYGAVIATAKSENSKFDIVSRVFVPGYGIDEDPVTGAAHCVLAPYWASKLDLQELKAFQASERGGELHLKLEGDRVLLSGQAQTLYRAHCLA